MIAEFYGGPFDGKVEEFDGPEFKIVYYSHDGTEHVLAFVPYEVRGRNLMIWPKGLM